MFFAVIVILIALGVASPYIIVIRKRQRMLKRLTHVAQSSGFRVRKLHRFVCFSFNRAPRYDVLFENKTHAYAVKLWSAVRKNATLYIEPDGTVMERADVPKTLDTGVSEERTVNSRKKRVAVTKNNFKVKKGKPVVGIMLYYPPNKQIILKSGASQKRIVSGDRVFDKILCNPGKFEQMLFDDGGRSSREMVNAEQRSTKEIRHK